MGKKAMTVYFMDQERKKDLLKIMIENENIPFSSIICLLNRKVLDINTSEAAEQIGVSRQAYQQWESGLRNPSKEETQEKIAKGLNFNLKEFSKEYWNI